MNDPAPPTEDGPLPPGSADSLGVLLIEGHPEDARRFEECLQESGIGASFRHESTLEAGLQALGEEKPDVVAVSTGLSGSEAADAVETVVSATPELPVVVLVGPEGAEVALQVRKAGVAESLRKEALSPPLLGRTLQWALKEERMQQKLRQRDAWVRSITESLSAGVFRCGPTGRIKYANQALARMLGLGKGEDLVGRDLTDFYANPHQRGRMLAAEGASAAEVTFKRIASKPEESEELTGLLSAEAAYNASGTPVHYDGTITDITDWKEKEAKLRVLSEAVQQAKEAVLITEAGPLDKPGPRVEYVNEAFEEMTGYSQEEIVGKTPRVLQGPETSREVLDSVREALEKGEEWEGEATNYRKGGEPYRVQWNLAPVRGEDGSVEHWVSVQREVTEERKREESLRRQKSLLEQTQRLAGAWEVDLETKEVMATDEVYRIHGLDPETEMSFEEGIGFYAPEAREKARAVFERCVEEEEPYDLEVPLITVEGNRRWVRAVGAPAEVSEEDGEVVKVAGALQDITKRKKAEQELQESRERLQMAVEGGNIGTWDWDVETGEVIFNRQWAEMLGYSREELDFHFSTWEDLVHPEDLKRAMEVLGRYIAGETDRYAPEIRMRTKSGEWKWVQTIGKVIDRDEHGEVTRAAGIHLDIDERKKSRQELKRYRKYTGRMLDAIDDLFYVLDGAGKFRRWNDSLPAVTGYSDEELGQMNALDLVPGEQKERVAAKIEDGFAEGHARMEVPLLRKDGTTVPYEVGGNLIEHPEEGPLAVVIGRDITERRRREKRIERRNDLFRRAQEIADVGAWEYEVESGRLTWTEQVHKIYGLSPEENPTLDRALTAYHPDDRPKIQDAFDRAIHEKDPYDLELRLILQGGPQEGEERWVRTRGEPVHENGAVTSVRGTIQDVTDQKEAEAEARSMKNYYEQILNQIPIDLAVFTPEATFEYTNPQSVRDPKVRDWLKGRTNEDYFRENDRDVEIGRARDRCIRRVAQEKETAEIEETIQGENGPRHFLRVHGPVTDLNGEVTNVVAFGLDITERKRREEQLRKAKEDAESANRMKSAFLATMSHEIRTPLTSILGFAEAIETEAEDLDPPVEAPDLEPLGEFAGLIQRSGKRLMKTLTGVLNLSRLEAGEMDLASRPVDLAEQADEVAEELRPRAEEKGLALQVETEGSAWACADEGGVQIVLRNLLSNAIKYTESGSVEVRAYEEEEEAVLEVEDTGIGMDASQVEDLFEPFRQASEGVSREYEGTGLGLAVTREATQEMGGRVEIDTQKGEGSRFAVRLPRAEAH